MKNRTITLFLGAGFSRGIAGEKFPLTKDLLAEIKRTVLAKNDSELSKIKRLETEAKAEEKEQPFEEVLKLISDKIETSTLSQK